MTGIRYKTLWVIWEKERIRVGRKGSGEKDFNCQMLDSIWGSRRYRASEQSGGRDDRGSIKNDSIGEGGGFRMGNTCIPVADSF